MNKLLWRFMKISAVMVLMYIAVVQVWYRASQSTVPFKRNKLNFSVYSEEAVSTVSQLADSSPEKSAPSQHVTPNNTFRPAPHQDGVPVNQSAKVEDAKPPAQSRLYVNTLLKEPQQKFNFYHHVKPAIWPDSSQPYDDRIISQMTYALPTAADGSSARRSKEILVYSHPRNGMLSGKQLFISQRCPVPDCNIVFNRNATSTADVILLKNDLSLPSGTRPANQIWIVFILESPYHAPNLGYLTGKVNWTSTYRRDSTIVAPYERFTLFNSSVEQLPLTKNYASGKTKKVAWFVSNCHARNNRLGYAKELAKYIEVDIYGACGSMSCPKSSDDCLRLLSTTYKFYLAFENSNCRDYITEKFFVNGLKNDVLPIVMGAHPDDYKNAAPKNSYIHVDDFASPEMLAQYLNELDKDDDEYNKYFHWKGTGDNLNTYFWCRLCAMAHAADTITSSKVYSNFDDWWRGPTVCRPLANKLWPKW